MRAKFQNLPTDLVLEVALYSAEKSGAPSQVLKAFANLPMKILFERLHCIQYSLQRLEILKESFGKVPETLKELNEVREKVAASSHPDPIFHLWKVGATLYGSLKHAICTKNLNCEMKDLNAARLSDLQIRLNCPYPYIHCDQCEHFLVFQKARLVNFDLDQDLVESSQGFVELVKQKERKKICRICDYYFADWIVKNDRLAPDNHLCQQCLESLHYGPDGKVNDPSFILIPYLGK